MPPGPRLAWWGRSPKAWSTTQHPTLGTLPGGAGEAASLVPKLPRSWGRIAKKWALTKPGSAARFPAPRPSSNGRRGPPLRRGGGTAHGPSPGEKPRRVREACGSLPVAFGYFWPDKSTAPVPARGGNPALCADLNSGQRPLPAPLARFIKRAKRAPACRRNEKAPSGAFYKVPLRGGSVSGKRKSARPGAFFTFSGCGSPRPGPGRRR